MPFGFSIPIVDDVVDAGKGLVDDAADAIGGAAETAFDYGSDTVKAVSGSAWGGALAAIDTVEDISPDVPWVDVEVDAGQLSTSVDVAGYGAGLSVGERGVEAHYDGGVMGAGNIGITDEGFDIGLAIGDTDWPQWMPATEVGFGGDWDGNFEGHFESQGAIPIPGANGVVWGEVGGEFHRNDDGTWGVGGHAEGTYLGADGTRAGGSLYGSYTRTEDGSVTTAGASGYYAREGVYVGGSVDYARLREGDDILESLDAAAQFKGWGFEGSGAAAYRHAEIDGDEMTHFEAVGEVSGRGIEASGSATYDELTTDDGTVSNWETEYSLDGVEELVGDEAASLADEAGLDLDGVEEAVGDPLQPLDDGPDPAALPEPAPLVEEPPPAMEAPPEPAPAPEPEPAPAPSAPDPLDELDNL